jgi:hypothetical protein
LSSCGLLSSLEIRNWTDGQIAITWPLEFVRENGELHKHPLSQSWSCFGYPCHVTCKLIKWSQTLVIGQGREYMYWSPDPTLDNPVNVIYKPITSKNV